MCKYLWPVRQLAAVNLPQSTCRSQLAPIDQTSYIYTKLINAQVGCVTNVDYYSLCACTYVASVRPFRRYAAYTTMQVIFAAVKQLQQFEEKTTNILTASGFHKIPCIINCACAHTTICYWKITCIHYFGLVNSPHSSSCPMFPYIICPLQRGTLTSDLCGITQALVRVGTRLSFIT